MVRRADLRVIHNGRDTGQGRRANSEGALSQRSMDNGSDDTNEVNGFVSTAIERERQATVSEGQVQRYSAEIALRTVIDSGVFAALRTLEGLDGASAVQTMLVALIRRLPNVELSRERLASDTGYSVSTVKRAIKLLEACQLIKAHRRSGRCPRYELFDLRENGRVARVLASIRTTVQRGTGKDDQKVTHQRARAPKIAQENSRENVREESRGDFRGSRARSEPTGRAGSEPGGRVRGEPEPGSGTNPKGTSKKQIKKQGFGADGDDAKIRQSALDALHRWGITTGAYVLDPNHHRSIGILVEHPDRAGAIIDRAMSMRSWSPEHGAALRIEHLRSHAAQAYDALKAHEHAKRLEHAKMIKRYERVMRSIPKVGGWDDEHLNDDVSHSLLQLALENLNEPKAVLGLIQSDAQACDRLIAYEWLKQSIYEELDTLDDEALMQLKQEVLQEQPARRNLLEHADPRTSPALRIMLMRTLLAKRLSG